MNGTVPVFYKIPVTRALADAVAQGVYPGHSTILHKFVTPVPLPEKWDNSVYCKQGMVPLESRLAIFRCYEAFKKFVSSLKLFIDEYCILT